jgi:hypothetical protein
MDGFDIFMIFMTYSLIATIFALILDDEKDNLLGRAFIWPMILLIAMVKAIRSVYLETKAEMKDYVNTVKKK